LWISMGIDTPSPLVARPSGAILYRVIVHPAALSKP
jgi:hypothetical protein